MKFVVAPDFAGLGDVTGFSGVDAGEDADPFAVFGILANSNINVNVTEDEIALSGSVSNGKARQTAERIARSFAENRRVSREQKASHVAAGTRETLDQPQAHGIVAYPNHDKW